MLVLAKEYKSGVYSLRHLKSGKRYIGSAAHSILGRIKDHRLRLNSGTHANQRLQNAWNKYGASDFVFSILHRCDPKDCVRLEQVYIDRFKSFDARYGYNICVTAGSRLGVKLSKATRARFSKTAKEAMNRPEVRAKLSAATKSAMERPELRKILSLAAKKRFSNKAARELASKRAVECQSRPEVKAKKMATLSLPETKIRLSASAKAGWLSRGKNGSSTYRPDWSDSEYRRKQSESMRLGWARRNAAKGATNGTA